MGFIGYQEELQSNPLAEKPDAMFSRVSTPGVWGTAKASFLNNGSVKLYNSKRGLTNQTQEAVGLSIEKDAGWDPLVEMKNLGPNYDQYYAQFVNTQNKADFEALKADIDSQHEIDKTLGSLGASTVGMVGGALADPTNFVPGVGIGRGAMKANKLGTLARRMVADEVKDKVALNGAIREEKLLDRLSRAESNNNPNAKPRINPKTGKPYSTAYGTFQFIDKTWVDTLNRYAPHITHGKSKEEIIALKNDPKLQRDMARNLLREQSKELESYGVPATEVSLSLAWIIGPKKAAEAMKARLNALIKDIFTKKEIEANPSILKPTAKVDSIIKYAQDRLGLDAAKESAQMALLGSAVEVTGQWLANPDYTADDAASTMMFAGVMGLGSGAIAKSVTDMQVRGLVHEVQTLRDAFKANLAYRSGSATDKAFDMFNLMVSSAGKSTREDFDTKIEDFDFTPQQARSLSAAAFNAKDPVSVYDKHGLGKYVRRMNPLLDTMYSMSSSAKRVVANLYDTNILTNKEVVDFEPLATGGSINTKVRMHMGKVAEFQDNFSKIYKEYQRFMMTRGRKAMSKDEFAQEAFSRGWGRGTASADEMVYIDKALDAAKKNVFQPFSKDVEASGLAKSRGPDYIPVIYSRQAIKSDISGFKQKVRAAAERGIRAAELAGKKVPFKSTDKAKLDEFVNDYTKFWSRDGVAALDEAALYDTATGRSKARSNVPLDYGALQDFMENDLTTVVHRYSRSVAPDVELMKKFGSLDLNNEKVMIKKEFDEQIAKAKPEQRAKLEKERDRILDNVDHMVKTLRNRDDYSMMTSEGMRSAIKAINSWTFVTKMGMFAVNSIGELGMATLTHGFKQSYGNVFKDMANGFKALKLAKEDAKVLGIAVDLPLSDRMMTLFDLHAPGYREGKVEQALESMSGTAAKLFGIPYINDAMRTASTMWNHNRFGDKMKALADWSADDFTKTDFANLGIGQQEARMIWAQMDKYGERVNDIFVPNLQKWDDQVASETYGAALMKAVDNDFIMPQGGADLPKLSQTPAGKVLLFMRSFMMTGTHRILGANAQRIALNPGRAKGVAGVLTAGLLSHLIYETAKGREVEADPLSLTYGAINRSGMLGVFWEANNTLDSVTGVGFGTPKVPVDSMGDLVKEGIGAVGGVNAFTAMDAADLISKPSGENAMALMPLQNHVLLEFAKTGLGVR